MHTQPPRAIHRTKIPFKRGRSFGLSLTRRFVCDLLHFSKKLPMLPMERRMHLQELIAARSALPNRISWCAIFLKAYGIVAASNPVLRRSYISFPWPHIYEHPENVASFCIEREYEGERGVFFARISRPEELSLRELDSLVRYHKHADIGSIPSFQHSLNLSRLPRPLRRFLWWLALDTDGPSRAHYFGTFAVSVVASLGAASLKILSPITSTVNYSQFAEDGSVDVRINYDHRVMDGGTVARLIVELESVLTSIVLEELQQENREFQSENFPVEQGVAV